MADTVIAKRWCPLQNVAVWTIVLRQAKQFNLKRESVKRHPTRRGLFEQQIRRKFGDETSKELHLDRSVLWW